jgi:hypothetical protein
MQHRVVLGVSLLSLLTVAVLDAQAQSAAQPWALTRAIKAKPGKALELEKYFRDTVKKYHQARKESGTEIGWMFNKVVLPAGEEAPYNYSSTTFYDKYPPLDEGVAAAAVEKAGTTQERFTARINELTTLTRISVSRRLDNIGQAEAGDFIRIDYMKVPAGKGPEYVNLERTIYKPLQEQRVKDGIISAWTLSSVLFPAGTERPYDFFTTNVVKRSEDFGNPNGGYGPALFAKVLPNVNYVNSVNRTQELRTIVRTYFLHTMEVLR